MNFNQQASTYEKTRGGLDRGQHAAGDLAPFLAQGPVLDVGVGTGAVAVAFRDLGHEVTGVDTAPKMLEVAAQRLGSEAVRLASAQALPFPERSFGNVVFAHVLHLVPDMAGAVAEGARVLRTGGRMLVLHGQPTGEQADDLALATRGLRPLQEDRPDTPDSLAAAASAVGLQVVAQDLGSPFELSMSPTQFSESIAERRCPFLFHTDAATWHELVEPAIAALRALPDQDKPRVNRWRVRRSVFEKPG